MRPCRVLIVASTGASAWPLFSTAAMASFSDGVMPQAGSVVSLSLVVLLALAQTTGDLPEAS